MTPKEPGEFDEVTPGTDPDATDLMPENTLPVEPGALGPEVVDVRTGMFGVHGTGDTSGYGGLVRPVAMPGGTPRPYGGWFDEVATRCEEALATAGFADAIEKVVVDRGELTFFIRRRATCRGRQTLRDDLALRFELCSGGVRRALPGRRGPRAARGLPPDLDDLPPPDPARGRAAPTATRTSRRVIAVYPTADWHERETYDMFGIVFDGHPTLTRILMPDDWDGSPAAQGLPARWHPGRVQGRRDPAAGPAEVVQLMSQPPGDPGPLRTARGRRHRRDDRQGLHRHRRRLGRRRRAAPTRCTTSGSSSTWVRSTRPRTACSG